MRLLILLLTLPLFALDFATKEYVVQHFAPPTDYTIESRPVIEGVFDLVRVHNTGVAFGMANETKGANLIFGVVSIAAVLLIGWLWRTNAFPTKTSRVAVALLLSGIFGNLLDRILRGYVVDFLHVLIPLPNGTKYSWPAFNVADSAICIAAVLLFFSAFQNPTPLKK
jgi:signal peptidase II